MEGEIPEKWNYGDFFAVNHGIREFLAARAGAVLLLWERQKEAAARRALSLG